MVLCQTQSPMQEIQTRTAPCDISVRNPIVVDKKYVSYEILLQTTNKAFSLPESVSRRRYSEFLWLRNLLKKHHPLIDPPSMPAKRFLLQLDPNFIAFRKKQLEEFLMKLIAEPLYLSDSALHLFLQTDLSIEIIEDYIAGNVSQGAVDRAIGEMTRKTAEIQAATANLRNECSRATHSDTHSEREAPNNNVTETVGDSERETTGDSKAKSFSTTNTVTANAKLVQAKNSKPMETVVPDPSLRFGIN